ncbi:MAG: Rrf2 family transcriptional regulator [Sneathiellaceae bacterium]
MSAPDISAPDISAPGILPAGIASPAPKGRAHYAVVALAEIAGRSCAAPVPLNDIARRHGLSLRYLEQIFNRLRRAGLVRSVRGPGGGYCLRQPAEEISIAAISAAAEPDCGNPRTDVADLLSADCPVCRLWGAAQTHTARFLQQVSLADVAAGRIPAAGPGPAAGIALPVRDGAA